MYERVYWGWFLLACAAIAGCDTSDCTDMDCLGPAFEVTLLDADGAPATAARGEIDYSRYGGGANGGGEFDCSVSPDSDSGDVNCDEGVLRLSSVSNPGAELRIRFEREDGTFSDWKTVELTIERKVLADFNGPGCDCTIYQGSASAVTLPPL